MAISQPKLRDTFARRLKEARLAAGLSQRELGRRIGLSEEVVSSRVTRYERGSSEPDFMTANRLAKELGMPLAFFLADNEPLAELILIFAKMPSNEQKKLVADMRTKLTSRPPRS